MALAEAAVQGIEVEAWKKQISKLMYNGKQLYTRFKKGAKTYESANITSRPNTAGSASLRPAFAVPFYIQSGSAIQQITGNGDSLGRGTGGFWTSGDINPIVLSNACEITWLARRATSGPNRGLMAVRAEELKNSLASFMRGLEALMQGDSSGMLDQIPTTATVNNNTGTGVQTSSIVGLNNANQFQDQQTLQVFPSEGGSVRGTFVVSFADGVAQTIYSSTALPSGTTQGDYLMVAGSSGALGGSLAGIKTYQVTGNTGTYLGVTKASYPGRLSTPNINLSGAPINPTTPYRADILIDRGLGADSEEKESLIWYCGPDQQLAITNLFLNLLTVQYQEVKGDSALDMVKKNMTPTFGGREMLVGYNATPGRIDGLCLSSWGIAELQEPSLYEFGNGATTMPVVDISTGGYNTSDIFYYIAAFNPFNSNPKAGVYITNAQIPTI
jgi:hypothetical protein